MDSNLSLGVMWARVLAFLLERKCGSAALVQVLGVVFICVFPKQLSASENGQTGTPKVVIQAEVSNESCVFYPGETKSFVYSAVIPNGPEFVVGRIDSSCACFAVAPLPERIAGGQRFDIHAVISPGTIIGTKELSIAINGKIDGADASIRCNSVLRIEDYIERDDRKGWSSVTIPFEWSKQSRATIEFKRGLHPEKWTRVIAEPASPQDTQAFIEMLPDDKFLLNISLLNTSLCGDVLGLIRLKFFDEMNNLSSYSPALPVRMSISGPVNPSVARIILGAITEGQDYSGSFQISTSEGVQVGNVQFKMTKSSHPGFLNVAYDSQTHQVEWSIKGGQAPQDFYGQSHSRTQLWISMVFEYENRICELRVPVVYKPVSSASVKP